MSDINYHQIGEVLKLFQIWEEKFKIFTIKHGIEKSEDKRSLSNMASFLFKKNSIKEEEYLSIKKIIILRNYFIHRLFLDDEESINDITLNTKANLLDTIKIFE